MNLCICSSSAQLLSDLLALWLAIHDIGSKNKPEVNEKNDKKNPLKQIQKLLRVEIDFEWKINQFEKFSIA